MSTCILYFLYDTPVGSQLYLYYPIKGREKPSLLSFFFFFLDFHPIVSVLDDNYLSSDQDINQF